MAGSRVVGGIPRHRRTTVPSSQRARGHNRHPRCKATTPAVMLCTLHRSKPGVLEHLPQHLLRRMHADGLGEVAVALGVAGNPAPQPGQHAERVGVVDRLQRRRAQLRELEHRQLPARAQHAEHLAQRARLVRDVAQAEGDAHDVEAARCERQRLGVHLRAGDGGHQAFVDDAPAPLAQHRRVDVGEYHLALVARPRPRTAAPCRRSRRRGRARAAPCAARRRGTPHASTAGAGPST